MHGGGLVDHALLRRGPPQPFGGNGGGERRAPGPRVATIPTPTADNWAMTSGTSPAGSTHRRWRSPWAASAPACSWHSSSVPNNPWSGGKPNPANQAVTRASASARVRPIDTGTSTTRRSGDPPSARHKARSCGSDRSGQARTRTPRAPSVSLGITPPLQSSRSRSALVATPSPQTPSAGRRQQGAADRSALGRCTRSNRGPHHGPVSGALRE